MLTFLVESSVSMTYKAVTIAESVAQSIAMSDALLSVAVAEVWGVVSDAGVGKWSSGVAAVAEVAGKGAGGQSQDEDGAKLQFV